MLQDFSSHAIPGRAGLLHTRRAGQGPAVLLGGGGGRSHVMWHRVAPALAQHFTVVMMDLRGYGDSARPAPDAAHAVYSKRAMAQDAMDVMQQHEFECFQVLAHDRGARVAHRLALDHPQAVERLLLLDVAPTLAMYENTTEAFARAYWHWFFLIQPSPLPEALIASDPVRYVRSVMGSRHAGLAAFAPDALAEYERCAQIAGTATGICEDYRASATIDLEHDRTDLRAGLQLAQPLRVLWAEHGAVGQCFDVLALWRKVATAVSGQSLTCGHYMAEELPDAVLVEALQFFKQ